MPEWLLTFILKGWLVAACLLFAGILFVTFRPSARGAMDSHARIPFLNPEDHDGQS